MATLRRSESFGPLRPADYENEVLDEPVLPLADAVFRVSQSSSSWMYWLLVFVLKPCVNVLFGDIMNRGILYALHWLTSERRMAYYLYLLREVLWPNGRWAPDAPSLTKEQGDARRERLRGMLDEFLGMRRLPWCFLSIIHRA